MPKLLCKCGVALGLGDIPNPIEWRLISDVEFEKFRGTVDAEAVYMATDTMLRCPSCGRLWIFWENGEAATEYLPAT